MIGKYKTALQKHFFATSVFTFAGAILIFVVVGMVLPKFGLPMGMMFVVLVVVEAPFFYGIMMIAAKLSGSGN